MQDLRTMMPHAKAGRLRIMGVYLEDVGTVRTDSFFLPFQTRKWTERTSCSSSMRFVIVLVKLTRVRHCLLRINDDDLPFLFSERCAKSRTAISAYILRQRKSRTCTCGKFESSQSSLCSYIFIICEL